jgi:hypothetical protein
MFMGLGWDDGARQRYERFQDNDKQRLWRYKHPNDPYVENRFKEEYRKNHDDYDRQDRDHPNRDNGGNRRGGDKWENEEARNKFDKLSASERQRLWKLRHEQDGKSFSEDAFREDYRQNHNDYEQRDQHRGGENLRDGRRNDHPEEKWSNEGARQKYGNFKDEDKKRLWNLKHKEDGRTYSEDEFRNEYRQNPDDFDRREHNGARRFEDLDENRKKSLWGRVHPREHYNADNFRREFNNHKYDGYDNKK